MSNRRLMTVASSLAALALAASAVLAASPIEDRQAAMKAIGKATGELAKIAKKETKFDAATVKANAEIIHDKLGAAKALFPEGSGPGRDQDACLPGDLDRSCHLRGGVDAGRGSLACHVEGHQRKGVHAGSR